MPKMKTHRGAAKRFKITGSGKIMQNASGMRHFLAKKAVRRKRRLAGAHTVNASNLDRVNRMLPNAK